MLWRDGADYLVNHQARESENGIERCAELVGHVGEKCALQAVRLLNQVIASLELQIGLPELPVGLSDLLRPEGDLQVRLSPQSNHLQLRPHPSEYLAAGEGLDQVVVDSCREPIDAGLLPCACGEHHHRNRHRTLICSQLAKQLESVEVRHHHVSQHQVGHVRSGGCQRLHPVLYHLDRPVFLEEPAEIVAQVGIVVRHENSRPRDGFGLFQGCGAPDGGAFGKPTRRFVRERIRAGGEIGRARSDAVLRKVARPRWHQDGKRRPPASLARDPHSPAMQLHQFLNQCQTNSRSFDRPGLRTLHPMEAVEHLGQLHLGNPDAGVFNRQDGLLSIEAQGDPDFSFEGKFEGIGDEVEDDLLPHLAVHVDWL